jgi:hypothetical protein
VGTLGVIAAAPAKIDDPVVVAKQQSPAPIAPHRAIYTMGLASVKNGSTITDVSGHMLFEWRDVCDGWAIQQHMQLHFTYADSDDQDVVSTELTWEAKDGKRYNFNIRRVTNGQETENYRGKAVQNPDGSVSVAYSTPEGKTLQLPVGTLFPSAHTALILQDAARGENFFTRRVFDGSDEDGSSDISVFVTPQHAADDAGLNAKVKENPLLSGTAWPVHMAFFKTDDKAEEPDYEMDLNLFANGVARRLKIDYGDFSVMGNLDEIQELPAANCP